VRTALALVIVALAPAISVAAPQSNPAFLGIVMSPIPCQPAGCIGGILIANITAGSPAAHAGFLVNDIIVRIDGASVQSPQEAIQTITAKHPGDTIDIDVRRGGAIERISSRLSTRAEVLFQRIGGHIFESGELVAGDGQIYDLAEPRGHATIVGFVTPACVGCDRVFARMDRWTRKHPGSIALAITNAEGPDLKSMRSTFDVPVVESNETRANQALLFEEPERMHVIVIDSRGEVQFVAPIAPQSDDVDTAIDEVLAAAEQAQRPRR
jgi:membrane-associated protease RseP (regulator of RpoE activity)